MCLVSMKKTLPLLTLNREHACLLKLTSQQATHPLPLPAKAPSRPKLQVDGPGTFEGQHQEQAMSFKHPTKFMPFSHRLPGRHPDLTPLLTRSPSPPGSRAS